VRFVIQLIFYFYKMHPTRIFKTPEDLLKSWEEYKSDRDNQASKWEKVQYVGKDGERVTDKPPMPYDLDGFVSWYKNKYGHYIHQYFKRTEEYSEDFLPIVTHILSERNDNIKTGTLLGFFNSSMGNRIVGLAEKTENKNTEVVKILNIDPLDDSTDNKPT
jgi:hypothetical protein